MISRLGDEVGPLRVADDQVADLLRPEARAVEMIARLDAAPLELALEEMRRDGATLRPQDCDRDGKEDQDRERGDFRFASTRSDERRRSMPVSSGTAHPSSIGRLSLIGFY